MTNMVKQIYKDKDVIIVLKPSGMPSQSDPSNDKDAMTAASELLSSLGEESSLWLIHRLDRNVGGLIAFARNKKSAAELSRLVSGDGIRKKYFAVCHGIAESGEYRDFLFKDSATSKSYVVKNSRKGAKEAILYSEKMAEYEDSLSLVSIELKTGRFHQIRSQFSSRKMPLVGDKKYGSRDSIAKEPSLFAYSLSFNLFGRKIKVRVSPPKENYPWSLFDEKLYDGEYNENRETVL